MRLLLRCVELIGWSVLFGVRYVAGRVWTTVDGADGGTVLAAWLESLGPTFVKGGQILSTRPDLLPPHVTGALARLQDRVAPVPTDAIEAVLTASLGRPVDAVFDAFDPVPLSSASVAQVHRARLPDGRDVAVKIRRPGVVARVRNDLRLMRAAARVLQRVPGLTLVPFEGFVDAFGGAVERQLDFEREAAHNRRFRAHFRVMPSVRIPALVDALCTDAVLVMEYVDGLQKVDALRPGVAGLGARELQEAAVIGLKALYKMIFVDGFIHGDMHPANVFFVDGPAVVLLDFGLVAELPPRELQAFVTFFRGLSENDGRACARVLLDEAPYRAPNHDADAFTAAMVTLIDRHASLRAADFEVTRFATDLFATMRDHGIRGPATFTLTILSLLVYEGIVKHVHPTLDFQKEARLFILRAHTRLVERRQTEQKQRRDAVSGAAP